MRDCQGDSLLEPLLMKRSQPGRLTATASRDAFSIVGPRLRTLHGKTLDLRLEK
jgi:hypothetical protein